jgi:D-threo-aldose 1-dehydrogenase
MRFDSPLRAAALQFALAHPAVTCVLLGARSVEELDDSLAHVHRPLPDELWAQLRREQLLPEHAPVPGEDGG